MMKYLCVVCCLLFVLTVNGFAVPKQAPVTVPPSSTPSSFPVTLSSCPESKKLDPVNVNVKKQYKKIQNKSCQIVKSACANREEENEIESALGPCQTKYWRRS